MKDYEALSKKHFDAQSAVYDETDTPLYSKYPKISCGDTAKRLRGMNFGKLLDIGCGTGYLIDLLIPGHPDSEFCGLDLSPEMLKVAKKKLGDKAELTEGSALSLPFGSDIFDVVTCIQSFHHYPDPAAAMAEAFRVTSPGGMYILSDTGCEGVMAWLENHIVLPLAKTGDYRASSKDEIASLMQSAGFRVTVCEKIDRFIYTVIGVKPDRK